jgi:hypothetical protein
MSWCFAILNGWLAEIYFKETKRGNRIFAHCYVKESEYKTKHEQHMIKADTAKVKLVYRNGRYSRVKSY